MSNTYNSSDYFNFTVGQSTEEFKSEFMMMFSVGDLALNLQRPKDIDRIGILRVYNQEY